MNHTGVSAPAAAGRRTRRLSESRGGGGHAGMVARTRSEVVGRVEVCHDSDILPAGAAIRPVSSGSAGRDGHDAGEGQRRRRPSAPPQPLGEEHPRQEDGHHRVERAEHRHDADRPLGRGRPNSAFAPRSARPTRTRVGQSRRPTPGRPADERHHGDRSRLRHRMPHSVERGTPRPAVQQNRPSRSPPPPRRPAAPAGVRPPGSRAAGQHHAEHRDHHADPRDGAGVTPGARRAAPAPRRPSAAIGATTPIVPVDSAA